MPTFVNNNAHPVRVQKGAGLQRLRPGQVVEADGEYADALSATPGVDNATKKASDAYAKSEEQRRAADAEGEPGRRLSEKLALGPARTAIRRAVAAPLRRVVGDDAAPHGPASGELSSKAEEAAKSDAGRRAFAPGEALPGQKVKGVGTPPALLPASSDPSSGEVHNAQADAAEQAEEALDVLQEAGEDVIASKPYESTPPDDDSADKPADDDGEDADKPADKPE